jgi:signal recognition particle subunit SRP54
VRIVRRRFSFTRRQSVADPMLENLTQRLSRVVKELRGEARLTEENIQEALREVRLALLDADVALPVVRTSSRRSARRRSARRSSAR